VNADRYAGAAAGWASGATLVYAPVAALLVARTPIPLAGARVLDVGAGTGVCEAPLQAAGVASVVAADLSHDMLAWNRANRPPGVVSDVMRLPFPGLVFDAGVASFVLNHLTDPVWGFVELARVVRPGGAVLTTRNGAGGGDSALVIVSGGSGGCESLEGCTAAVPLSMASARCCRA